MATIVYVSYGAISGNRHSSISDKYTQLSTGKDDAVEVVTTQSSSLSRSSPTCRIIRHETSQPVNVPMPGSSSTVISVPERVEVWLFKVGTSGTLPAFVMLTMNRTTRPGAEVFTSFSTVGSIEICISRNSRTVTVSSVTSRRRVIRPAASSSFCSDLVWKTTV